MIILGSISQIWVSPDRQTKPTEREAIGTAHCVVRIVLFLHRHSIHAHRARAAFSVLGALACAAGVEVFDCLSLPKS